MPIEQVDWWGVGFALVITLGGVVIVGVLALVLVVLYLDRRDSRQR